VPPLRALGASPFTLTGSSFSRSYGCILPSSLTTVNPIALVFSTCPPELVWGTGTSQLARGFSWQHGINDFAFTARFVSQTVWGPDLPGPRPTHLPQDNRRLGSPILLRPLIAFLLEVGRFVTPRRVDSPLATKNWNGRCFGGTGISTGCASTTPFGLALAPDLPWED
jgi:hypothetical protein